MSTPVTPDFAFDIATARIYAMGGPAGRADRLELVLGTAPQLIAFQQNGDSFTAAAGSQLIFGLKPLGQYNALEYVVSAVLNLPADAAQASAGEDWTAALLALFDNNQPYIDFTGQLGLRLTADPAGTYRTARPFIVRVWNSVFAAGVGLPGVGIYVRNTPFTDLVGGGVNNLDGFVTVGLPVDTSIAVVIRVIDGANSLSFWQLKAGTDAEDYDPASPGTASIIRPDDYNGSTNAKVWVKVSGT